MVTYAYSDQEPASASDTAVDDERCDHGIKWGDGCTYCGTVNAYGMSRDPVTRIIYCKHMVSVDEDCAACDYNESLGDGCDINDPAQRCRHGNFIGSPGGPDYLCGQCEMGDD